MKPVSKIVLLLAAVLVVVVHLAAFWIVGFDTRATPLLSEPGPTRPQVYFVSREDFMQDTVAQDVSELLDTAPLFLPTQFNFTTRALRVEGTVPEGPTFEPFGSMISDASTGGFEEKLAQDIESAFIALSEPVWSQHYVRASEQTTSSPKLKIDAFAESGHSIMSQLISLQSDDEDAFEEIWRPVTFSANFDALGMIGSVRKMQTSGNSIVDDRLLEIVDQAARNWTPNRGGWVRLVVSPWISSNN